MREKVAMLNLRVYYLDLLLFSVWPVSSRQDVNIAEIFALAYPDSPPVNLKG